MYLLTSCFLIWHKALRYFLASKVMHIPVSAGCFPEGAHPGCMAHLLQVACLTTGIHPVGLARLCMYVIEVGNFIWKDLQRRLRLRSCCIHLLDLWAVTSDRIGGEFCS